MRSQFSRDNDSVIDSINISKIVQNIIVELSTIVSLIIVSNCLAYYYVNAYLSALAPAKELTTD